jgi:hypothetical protein
VNEKQQALLNILQRVRNLTLSGDYQTIVTSVRVAEAIMRIVEEELNAKPGTEASSNPAECGLPGPGLEHGPGGHTGGSGDEAGECDLPDSGSADGAGGVPEGDLR